MAPEPSPLSGDEPEFVYDLYTRPDHRQRFWGPPDHGVRIAADHIAWTVEGSDRQTRLSDIVEINLFPPIMTSPVSAIPVASMPMVTGGPIVSPGICRIRFRGGSQLAVISSDALGRYDREHEARYREFVPQLHRRLSPAQRGSIVFRSGASDNRFFVNQIVFAVCCAGSAAILLLFLLPAAGWLTLIGVLFSGALLWFLYRGVQATRPGRYDPSHIPRG